MTQDVLRFAQEMALPWLRNVNSSCSAGLSISDPCWISRRSLTALCLMRSHSGNRQLMSQPPSVAEVRCAVQQMSSGKSPGADSIPAEIYKHGGEHLLQRLTKLCEQIWDQKAVPQDFKDAMIVHIFKRKGDRACYDDHRGISLLSIAGKIVVRVLLNRLSSHVQHNGEGSARESMRLPSWPGYYRHDLCCSSDSRKVSWTTPGSLHDFHRPNQGLRLCSQGWSLEGSEEDWMPGQVRQHCEILPRWHDRMCTWWWRDIFTLWHLTWHEAGLCTSASAVQHFLCHDAAGGLQGLRPRRVYAVQNGWQRLQPSSSPGKDESVLCHPSWSPLCWWLCTAGTHRICGGSSSLTDFRMRHAGLASQLASRRPRSCYSQQGEILPPIPVIKSGETVLKVVDRFCYLGSVLSSNQIKSNQKFFIA